MPKVYPKPRSIRAQAFEESNYPAEVEGLRCVEVMIPDSVEFMAQLAGLVALATKQFNYQNKDTARAAGVTALWREAYLATDWEGCMSCQDVADCIENNEATGDALRDWLNNNYNFADSDYPPNIPLPAAQRSADRAGVFNPGCDLDILWAQSYQLVEFMNERISDALEIIEAATNSIEVAGALTKITGLDEISVDAIVDYGALLQDFVAENYAAAYTTTYRDQLACAIFCAAQDDCEISLDDLFNLFKDRVEAYFSTTGVFGVLDDVIDYLLGQSIDDTIVADAAFFLLWGSVVLANWIVGGLTNEVEIGSKALNVLLKLAVNDANNDWELLCVDCSEAHYIEVDLTADDGGFVSVAIPANSWASGQGWIDSYGGTPTASRDYISLEWTGLIRIDEMAMQFQRTPAEAGFIDMATLQGATVTTEYTATNSTNYPAASEVTATPNSGSGRMSDGIQFRVNSSPNNTDARITRIRLKVWGVLPTELTTNGWTTYTP